MPLTFTEADFTEAGPDAGNFTEADFEEGFTARLGNALKSFPQALADSTGGSIRGGARAADMVREQELLTSLPTGTATPTARQSRRAFEQALTSPEYQSRLTLAGDDPAAAARVEELYGPAAKLGVIRAPIDAARSASATDATTRQSRLEQSPTYQYGQAVSDVAREVYPTRADLDDKAESQILRALGGTAPSVALGLVPFVGPPAAVAQYGLAAGEQGAQEAVAAGRPETADIAFLANAGLGAASEAALGVAPRLLRITRAARLSGIAPEKFKTTLDVWAKANPIKASALEVAIREGAQESVEQAGQNVIARDVAGYDPDRPYSKDVVRAGVLGATTGLLLGGGGAGLRRLTQPSAKAVAQPFTAEDFTPDRSELDAALTELQAPVPKGEGDRAGIEAAPPELIVEPPVIKEYLTTEPKPTPEQLMARENVRAMQELRALKAQRAAAAPTDSPATITGSNVQQGTAMPAEAGEAAVGSPIPAPEISVPPAIGNPQSAILKGRPYLSPRADGIPDILDAIQELGGIKPPGTQQGKGEYDGYAGAFNSGPAAVLRGGRHRPDTLISELQGMGWRYETPDQLYQAVQSAAAQRDALTRAEKLDRTIRDGTAERLAALHQQALRNGVSHEQVGEAEAGLTTKERQAFKEEILELRRLAGVAADPAPTTESGDPDWGIAAAKTELRDAWNEFGKMGAISDPKADAQKMFNFYKALFKLARAYAAKGMASAQDFATALGLKLNAVVQAAWDDAKANTPKTSALQLDPGAVADAVDEFKERKFSARFADDERMAPEVRAATGNDRYQPIPNGLTVLEALAFVQEHGPDAALAVMKDESNREMPDRVRVTLGQAIIVKANHEYAATKSDAALDRAVDTAEWLTEYGTRLGQGVQAFAIWSRITPDGYVRAAVRAVKKAQAKKPGVKIPDVDPKTKRELHKQASDALKKPEGFQRDEDLADVLAKIAKLKGLDWSDLALAFWYANILSGWTTQARNLAGNLTNTLAEFSAHAAIRPQRIPSMLAGLYNGALRGAFDATNILRTGKVTGTRVGKLETPRALELVKFRGAAYPLNAWKYVFRVMAATDMVFFRSAEEMKAQFLARELARKEGLRGHDRTARLAELLHGTPGHRQHATAQANAEGLTGLARQRRIGEIIEQGRPATLVQEVADYGRLATFNQQPQGVMGALANAINSASGRFAPLRLVVPFTQVVANVTNQALNFTPWGYRRLFPSAFLETNWMDEKATPTDYQLQAARATLGTLGLVTLYALAQSHADDDDPYFNITAAGPQNPNDRNQLRETGWQPYSVKVGARYYSFKETPLHLGLSWLGSLLDARRYKKLEERDALTRSAYALHQVGAALLNQSFLSSLGQFFEGLSNDQVPRGTKQFAGLGRTATSLVIPNLAKQIDKLFDPTIYDGSTVQAAILRDVPIARRGLRPMLNALGEPVKTDVNPFLSVRKEDELWHILARQNAFISAPSKSMMVGDRAITPEEYYDLVRVRGQWLGSQLRKPEILNLIATGTPERAQLYVERYSDAATTYARARLKLRHKTPAGAGRSTTLQP